MFEEWKQAWRQAVENFRRELSAEGAGTGTRLYREVYGARAALRQLESELTRARRDLAHEAAQAQTCRRREAMASRIPDEDTARVAAEFATRHEERAAVLARKVDALEAELALRRRDLAEMEAAAAARTGGPVPASVELQDPGTPPANDAEFHRMERAARERAAEQRLEEMKRRMQR